MAQLSEDMVLSPEGCSSVDLRISGLAGHVCNIAADQSWRVHEVKDAIEAVTQISRWQQKLLCNTTKLTDGELLGNLVQGQFTELTLVRHSAEKADWLRLAHTEWSDLLKADKAAWADRDVVLAAVGQCGWALQHATEDLQGDREVVLEAVAQNGLTFQYAARELRQDWDIALAAVKQCGRALEFLADELIVNRDFMLAAMRQNGRSLKYAAHEFRADREVAMAAVRQCGSALVGAAKHLRADYELVAEAVLRDGGALAFAAAPLRADPELKALASQGCIRRESSGSFTSKAEPEAEESESRSYSFGNGTSDGNLGLKRVLGSKGALLCEMAKLGLPVPPGFCVTTHLDHVRGMQRGARPSELRDMLKERLAEVERTTGCRFGDPANPLLLSVRSEAGDSMIAGLNDSIAEAWVGRESDSLRFVCDTYRRLIVTYAQDVKHLDMQPFQDKLNDTLQRLDAKCELGRKHHDADIPVRDLQDLVASFKLIYQQQAGEEFPQDPEVQLWEALRAAFSPSEGSLHTVAATIQAMVFGNFGSLSAVGVVSLKEGANGTEVDGEWLANAQDRDMAAGLRTPQKLTTVAAREWAARQGMSEQERAVSFSSLEEEMPEVYASLIHCQDTLSSHLRSSPAVEFVVQEGTLWLVQGAEYSSASKADHLDNISDCSTGTPTSETTAEKTEVSLDLAVVDDTTSEHTEQTRTPTLCFGMSQEDPCPFECGARPQCGRPSGTALAAAAATGALAWRRCHGRRRHWAGTWRGRRLVHLHAAATDVDGDIALERLAELRGLRARELRKRLEELGLDTAGCVDKDMLLEVLDAADKSVLLGAPAEPAEPAPQEGAAEVLEAEPVDAVPKDAEPVQASPEAEEELPPQVRARLEELRGLRLRELRKELAALGLSTEGRVDREALLELLETQGAAALLMAHRSAIAPHMGDPNKIPKIPRKPACSPHPGSATVPIHMMRGADQYGVKAGSTRVMTVDLECGWGVHPTRFVLDTVCDNSLIKASVADALAAEDRGRPEWAEGSDPKLKIRQVSLHASFLGDLNCGILEIAAIKGKLPVPLGVAGILGMDFLRLFDWDIDLVKGTASATTAPEDGMGPVPYDTTGMRVVPLTPVRLPGLRELLACPTKLRVPGGAEVDCMGIADLCASSSMMNTAVAHKLGLTGPPQPHVQKAPEKPKKKEGKRGFATPEPEPEPAFQQTKMELDIGVGKQGPVKVETDVTYGDIEVFSNMGLAYNWPAAVLGPDALCRSRLIISTRLKSIWLPVSD